MFVTTHPLLTNGRGITSSEANHISNLAKEKVANLDRPLVNMTTVERTLHLNHGESVDLSTPNFDSEIVKNAIETRAKYYPLVAVLREAIKARQQMLVDIEKLEVKIPEFTPPKKLEPQVVPNAPELPELTPWVDDSWALAKFGTKQLVDMLSSEAEAAAYGQYIHNEGALARINSEPAGDRVETIPEGVVTKFFSSNNRVQDLFMEMQGKHREAEKRVNMYRSKIHDLVNAENQSIAAENRKINAANEAKTREWEHLFQRITAANHKIEQDYLDLVQSERVQYDATMNTLKAQHESDRKQARAEVAALKILIPEALQDVFNELKA